jgi:hypothetical protein
MAARAITARKQHSFVKYGADGTVTLCRGSRGSLRRTVIARGVSQLIGSPSNRRGQRIAWRVMGWSTPRRTTARPLRTARSAARRVRRSANGTRRIDDPHLGSDDEDLDHAAPLGGAL